MPVARSDFPIFLNKRITGITSNKAVIYATAAQLRLRAASATTSTRIEEHQPNYQTGEEASNDFAYFHWELVSMKGSPVTGSVEQRRNRSCDHQPARGQYLPSASE
jgi:hypothetical protein